MTLEEYHRQQSRQRGRRWFFLIAITCLLLLTLIMAGCSPALIRIEAPHGQRSAKAPALLSPDNYWSDWLNSRTATRITP